MALFKDEEKDGVRPIGIRNPLIKAIHRETISGSKDALIEFSEL